ncbi:hypothetical protein GGE67_001988 [Rhizobium leucaenae]|uniref:Uncharacterized protein n=1 Tax=Rhizobium leucaenae TaxID=29450 RepID=A0A7W6ZR61_9HYPH|nr:hypothetical protein [Rhizobium leucaenae]MBB6301379.1 hypothetical protein [Rhizobium leucaenae]
MIVMTTSFSDGARKRSACASNLFGSRKQPFALQFLSGQLAMTSDGLCFLADAFFRWLLIGASRSHLAEDTFALQFLLQNAKGLFDIVFPDYDLQNLSLYDDRRYFFALMIDRSIQLEPPLSRADAVLESGLWMIDASASISSWPIFRSKFSLFKRTL